MNGTISKIAAGQFGVVSRQQLVEAGISDDAIMNRVRRGQLRRVHWGVFAVGGIRLSDRGRWMAATLACGTGAVLSHLTAARLWGISNHAGAAIHVARTSGSRGGPRGVRLHRPRRLPPHEVTSKGPIPLTTVPRTLVDLAGWRDPKLLLDVFSASRRLYLLDAEACWRCIVAAPGRRGVTELAELLEQFEPFKRPSLSELQDRVLKLCLDAGLPEPETEYRFGDRTLDFVWPEQKVILEVDGRSFHHHRFDEDRDRDLDHLAMGYVTVRVTYQMIRTDPDGVVRRLRKVLALRTER